MAVTDQDGGWSQKRVERKDVMRKRGVVAGTVGLVLVTAAAVGGAVRRFEIKETSMAPALDPGDWVLARRRTGPLERGAIVVFKHPANNGMNLVKRIIGLPNEQITIESGRVVVNGALLADRWATGITPAEGTWNVPEDHVWVLGDNRGHSTADGRSFGTTPINDIDWVVVARYWPTSRAASLK
jgi:signal peptidase I